MSPNTASARAGPSCHLPLWCTDSVAPNETCQWSKRVFMTAVTKRHIRAGFAAAKIDFFRLCGTVLDRRKRTALVGAITKRLDFTLATRAPPVVLALFNVDRKWRLGRAHWICHEGSFGSKHWVRIHRLLVTVSLCRIAMGGERSFWAAKFTTWFVSLG